jgi:hypothetical protein
MTMTLKGNPYVGPFLKRLEHRYSRDYADMSMSAWIKGNTSLRGRPFTTDRYRFQDAIIDDMHPNMDVIKCSQVGLTEVEIRKALAFLVRNRGTRALFTLPNENLMSRVSQTRIKPLVERDAVFNTDADASAVRSKQIMQFGESFLYITGCTEADATSTSADAIFNDEVDLSPQEMLSLFNSRLQDSDWKIRQRFSTPTFPSYGIDLSYSSSDQRVYKVRCDSCGHWNLPEFSRSHCVIPGLPDFIDELTELEVSHIDELDLESAYVCCDKCRKPLDLGRSDNRQWVSTYPGRVNSRGYSVSPFATDRLPISYICMQLKEYKKTDYLRGFYNTVLGKAYSDGNIRLERSAIERCFVSQSTVPEVSRDQPVVVGLDMGQTCHLTLGAPIPGDQIFVFQFEAVPVDRIPERVAEICARYNVIAGGVDRYPYEPTADAIFEISKGRIVPVQYMIGKGKDLDIAKDKLDNVSHAAVNRTVHLDRLAKRVRRASIQFAGYGHYKETIIEHLRDLIRDETPETPAVWKALTKVDHYFHSLAFMLTGLEYRTISMALDDSDKRSIVLVAGINLPKDESSLSNKYVDRPGLGLHNQIGSTRLM